MKTRQPSRHCALRLASTVILCGGFGAAPAWAHHGVAGLGAAGLQGPGAPIEAATSATLPRGTTLYYLKLDHAKFERYTPEQDNEGDYSQFWMLGLGHGFTPWFSAYVFLPYNVKVDEGPDAFNTRGFADAALFGQIGFKYDEGFRLVPENESLDDQEDWHFTVFGGSSFPTGNADLRDAAGNIDPGKSTGFGKPSYTLGFTATKMLSARWTFDMEVSGLWFQEYQYDDGNRTEFGDEKRVNTSLVYRAFTNPESRARLDLVLEAQYLNLGRDRSNGVNEIATGGDIVYLLPGVRWYQDNVSFAFGIKRPVSKRLNEEDQQQGAEGKEDYRLVFSVSALF